MGIFFKDSRELISELREEVRVLKYARDLEKCYSSRLKNALSNSHETIHKNSAKINEQSRLIITLESKNKNLRLKTDQLNDIVSGYVTRVRKLESEKKDLLVTVDGLLSKLKANSMCDTVVDGVGLSDCKYGCPHYIEKERLSERNKKNADIAKKFVRLVDKYKSAADKVLSLSQENSRLKSDVTNSEKSVKDLNQVLDRYKNRVAEVEGENKDLKKKIDTLELEIYFLGKTINNYEDSKGQKDVELSDLLKNMGNTFDKLAYDVITKNCCINGVAGSYHGKRPPIFCPECGSRLRWED